MPLLYMTYPSIEKEHKIVELKVPGIKETLARQVVEAISKIRSSEVVVRKPRTGIGLNYRSGGPWFTGADPRNRKVNAKLRIEKF